MKRKNIIANILSIGLVLNSFNLNSFASTLSEDGRYETFKGDNIRINDIYENYNEKIKLEGKSIVNLASNITSKGVWSGVWGHVKIAPDLIKKNKDYTVIVENLPEGFQWAVTNNAQDVNYLWYRTSNVALMNSSVDYEELVFHINDGGVSQVLEEQIEKVNILILEGDYTSCENLRYFKGIESGFENALITQDMIDSGQEDKKNLGKYKVEVKSKGKNLVDISKIELGAMSPLATKVNQSIILNGTTTEEFTPTLTQSLDLKVGKTYSVSISKGFYNVHAVVRYTQDGKLNYITATSERPNIIIPEDSWSDIIFYYQINGSGLSFSNQVLYGQIEEGTTATEYSPYTETTSTVYLNSPLLEGDTLEYINGQLYHVHNSAICKLDGSDDEKYSDWRITGNTPPSGTSVFILNDTKRDHMKNMYLNKYNQNQTDYLISNRFLDGEISSGIAKMQYYVQMHFSIRTSDLISDNEHGFREWVKENPIEIIYRLENPIYEPIRADLSAQLFEDTTHISNNSNIPSNMEVAVDRTINKAIEYINLAKTSPTLDNIAIARMWINLLDDSLVKDDLQSSINNITEITDLNIEKKKVSANLDLYVKSENALSMSLDTNSVTFENYNNTEDIEKLGAVNITVSSSLPYDLNAYMPNGISNMDGTKTMDSNLLNIREDSTNVYKPFTGMDTKVGLKEHCSAGNNNLHTIDFKLNGSQSYDVDVYRTVIKFEAQQK